MNNKHHYPVIFTKENNGYSTGVPDLPGCFSQGDSLSESMEMTREAIKLFLEDYMENEYPFATNPADLKCNRDEFIMLVEF